MTDELVTDELVHAGTDERIIAIERKMRQEDPTLVAAFERLGSFESDDESGQRLLLLASAVVIVTAIATTSPVAWVLGVVGLYAWKRS